MNILTVENVTYDLNAVPNEVDDLQYCVLDCTTPKSLDYFFIPLIFLESFSSPAIVMEINGKEISMPLDWHIAVGDSETGNDLEILPLTSINDRGFEAFVFNPLKSYKPDFAELKVTNFYNDVKWHVPKTKNGQLLSVPISEGENPMCAFFIKDVSRQIETIDYGELF